MPELGDKRLLGRRILRGELRRETHAKTLEDLPDLSDRVRTVDDEELERLRDELEREATARAERIERMREERRHPPAPPPLPQIEPED
ncbi:MAG: hypothetical protein ACE5FG_02515 [Myxococcota bacterium]